MFLPQDLFGKAQRFRFNFPAFTRQECGNHILHHDVDALGILQRIDPPGCTDQRNAQGLPPSLQSFQFLRIFFFLLPFRLQAGLELRLSFL